MAKTYNTIGTFTAGNVLTAAEMNELGENSNNYRVPPMCRVTNTGGQTVNDATVTTLGWNAEDFDTDGMHDNSTNNARLTIVTAGVYLLTASVGYTAGVSDDYTLGIYHSTGTQLALHSSGSANTGAWACVSAMYEFAVAEYAYVTAYQNNSANTSRTTATTSFFSAVWLGQAS